MHAQTKQNLLAAMHGEAFAYAQYMLFGQHAREHGQPELADLYEKTAWLERLEHFAELATLAGLVGTDPDNLRTAMRGESDEIRHIYREFADAAAEAGDMAAADLFTELRNDERTHLAAFQAALEALAVATH